jgi:hypothetical protein
MQKVSCYSDDVAESKYSVEKPVEMTMIDYVAAEKCNMKVFLV